MNGPVHDRPPPISPGLFPPRADAAIVSLGDTAGRLAALGPEHFSVTCCAGGSTRNGPARMVKMTRRRLQVSVVQTLGCVGATREDAARRRRIARVTRRGHMQPTNSQGGERDERQDLAFHQ